MRNFMNNKELFKKNIIEACVNGNITVKFASQRLGFSERYVKKLKQQFKLKGDEIFLHGNCCKQPVSTISPSVKSKVVELKLSDKYSEANIKHFTELLAEYENISLSYSTVHRILKSVDIKSPRKHKDKKVHARRMPKSQKGIMLQTDGTPHEFFKGDFKKYSLHGFIDDATGIVTGLYLCENECLQGYLEITRQTLRNFGIPQSIYADGTNVFFSNNSKELTIEEQLSGLKKHTTQFGEIAEFLGIELIHAHSPQAKGKIERLWNTLHDRLRVEFTINNITTIEQANIFLKDYIKKYNRQFAKKPANKKSAFVPLPKGINLDRLLSAKFIRVPDSSNTISFNSQSFKIDCKECLHKKKITILINKKIGMKALYNDNLYNLIPILNNTITSSNDISDSIESIISNFIYFHCFRNIKA